MKKENKELVTKTNDLNEARYKLSTLEQKIILIVVSMIHPDDEDFKLYQIKTNEFIKLLGISRHSIYEDLKKHVKKLLDRTLEIPRGKGETESILFCNWFSSAEYYPKKGYMEFCFDPKLKPYLLKLKECFVSYRLKNVVQLKSFYSIRFYELLKQYEGVGHRTFEIEEIRRILSIKPHEYSLYKNFRIRVLEPAKQEVSEKTDISFTYTEIKEKRKVVYLKFEIASNSTEKEKEDKTKDMLNDDEYNELVKLLPEEYQTRKSTLDLIAKYTNENNPVFVSRNIKYANKYSKKNYNAFLNKCLENDYGLEFQEDEEQKIKLKQKKEERKRKDEEQKKKEEEVSKIIEEYIEENKEELRNEAMLRLEEKRKNGQHIDSSMSSFFILGEINEIAAKRVMEIVNSGS